MKLKEFFVAALSSALEQKLATADDVLRHATPDVLADALPRPLWARLLAACLGAPRVDAQLVLETVGVANVCEHVSSTIVWACIAEIADRALGKPAGASAAAAASATAPAADGARPLVTPPPPETKPAAPAAAAQPAAPVGPSIPAPDRVAAQTLDDVVAELAAAEAAAGPIMPRPRTPTGQRFRNSNTGIGRLGAQSRRPQAQATPTAVETVASARGRQRTEVSDYDVATEVGKDEWKNAIPVDDEQLVDWQSSEETANIGAEELTRPKR